MDMNMKLKLNMMNMGMVHGVCLFFVYMTNLYFPFSIIYFLNMILMYEGGTHGIYLLTEKI